MVDLRERRYKSYELVAKELIFVNVNFAFCCSKAIMSGINGNMIMSGWGNGHHPDNETKKADRDRREGLEEQSNGDRSSDGIGA